MKTAIIIPARYGSTRFPGKPLAMIAGKTMLQRVVEIGRQAKNADLLVATDDDRIAVHCREIGAPCVMTPSDCPTGSDRVLAAARQSGKSYDVLVSLQGDAPFTPPTAIASLIEKFKKKPSTEVATPVVRLRWVELDRLRESKKTTPFSGTTAIVSNGCALWFSKAILPTIRKEDKSAEFSPVYQHIGLYAYRRDILERFVSLPQSNYEKLEGLEQLRLIENGIKITAVPIEIDAGMAQAGIDSPEDLARAEAILSGQC